MRKQPNAKRNVYGRNACDSEINFGVLYHNYTIYIAYHISYLSYLVTMAGAKRNEHGRKTSAAGKRDFTLYAISSLSILSILCILSMVSGLFNLPIIYTRYVSNVAYLPYVSYLAYLSNFPEFMDL